MASNLLTRDGQVAAMGWTATTIPEEYDGLGLSYLELSVIAEELGRQIAPILSLVLYTLRQRRFCLRVLMHRKRTGSPTCSRLSDWLPSGQ